MIVSDVIHIQYINKVFMTFEAGDISCFANRDEELLP